MPGRRPGAAELAAALVQHRVERDFMDDPVWGIPCDSLPDVHAVHAAMVAAPGKLGSHTGWKVGTTNAKAWTSFNNVEPMRAPLFSSTVVPAQSASFSKAADNLTMIEAEFAFKLKKDLAATWASPVSASMAWDAVECGFLAVEVCGSRFLPGAFAQASAYQKVADGGMNVGLVLGQAFEASEMMSRDLAGTKAQLLVNGVVKGEGSGSDVLDDPINSVAWLANSLGRFGQELKAGMLVTTGAAAVISSEA
jgi:2-keto-4-pentenoate hydratase